MSYHRFVDPESGEEYGSFEVFWDDPDIPEFGTEPRNFDGDGNPVEPGYYWAPGLPGCLWDGEPVGPFETEADAIADAREQ